MLVKINIKVLPKHFKGTFYVKLLEVDSYRDDLLGGKGGIFARQRHGFFAGPKRAGGR